jgi:hypothetical protein
MNISLLTIARRNYCRPDIPRSTQRHNVLTWSRSVHLLGSKWLLAAPVKVKKLETPHA